MENDKKFWNVVKKSSSVGEITIYQEIYKGVDNCMWADKFEKELKELGNVSELTIYINSPGGDVFEGSAIYSIIKRQSAKKRVVIDGLAASIASVIAMAGDVIEMPENAMMMVHNPSSICWGYASDMRETADRLDKIRESMITTYMAKSGLAKERIIELMDSESWLSAEDCKKLGLCDKVTGAVKIAACADNTFNAGYKNNIPTKFIAGSADEMSARLKIKEKYQNILNQRKEVH